MISNFIIKFCLSVKFENLQLKDVQSFMSFFESEYSELFLIFFSFSENDIKVIMNEHITDLQIIRTGFRFIS